MATKTSSLDTPTIGKFESIIQILREKPVLKQIVASATGSITAIVCLNPISVLKVNIQNSATRVTISETFDRIRSTRGILGFWGGTQMGLVQSLPSTVIYMTTYEHFKTYTTAIPFGTGVAGAAARFVSCSAIAPLELVRTIQTGGSKSTARDLFRSIYRAEGLKGFYRGWFNSILRDCPFSAIYWYSFETLSPIYSDIYTSGYYNGLLSANSSSSSNGNGTSSSNGNNNNNAYSHMVTFLSGATSGVLAALSTHPFDVLKTQQQLARHVARPVSSMTDPGACTGTCGKNCTSERLLDRLKARMFAFTNPQIPIVPPPIKNAAGGGGGGIGVCITTPDGLILDKNCITQDCARVKVERNVCTYPRINRAHISLLALYRADGISALFKGLSMRLMTVIPSSAIMVTVYKGVGELVNNNDSK